MSPTNEIGYWLEAVGFIYHPDAPCNKDIFRKPKFEEVRQFVAMRLCQQEELPQDSQGGSNA